MKNKTHIAIVCCGPDLLTILLYISVLVKKKKMAIFVAVVNNNVPEVFYLLDVCISSITHWIDIRKYNLKF